MDDSIKISRLALHEQAAMRLRTMLVEGYIQPGSKLNERELCGLLHVSRTPLREAIKLLASEGMVLPNRGAVAVKLSEADVQETFEVLANLEGFSGELAAQRITDQELAELYALHLEMMASYTRQDLSNYYRLNALIHAGINRAAKNPILCRIYTSINTRVQSLRFRTNLNADKWKRAVKEHEQMIEALQARDSVLLRKVLINHIENKRDSVLALLRSGDAYSSKLGKQLTS